MRTENLHDAQEGNRGRRDEPDAPPSRLVSILGWVLFIPLLPFALLSRLALRLRLKRQERELDLLQREAAILRSNWEQYVASLPSAEAARERASVEAEMAEARRQVEREFGPRPKPE